MFTRVNACGISEFKEKWRFAVAAGVTRGCCGVNVLKRKDRGGNRLCSAKILYVLKIQAFPAEWPDGCQKPERSIDNWIDELAQADSGGIRCASRLDGRAGKKTPRLTPEGRARIAAAVKARWAKQKKAAAK